MFPAAGPPRLVAADADVLRVRVLASWCDARTACALFNRMATDGRDWPFEDLAGGRRRLQLTWDDDDPDAWVVLNAPQPDDPAVTRLDPARTVVFQMEPLMGTDRMRPLWGPWAAPSPRSFLQVRDHRRYRNSNDWWLGLTYTELARTPLPHKDRTMAACVSAKFFDPGHRKRLDFLHFLDGAELGFELDIYGSPENGFRRFVAPTPPHDKRAALLSYRYAFDAENNATSNFFTEKIVDCLLAETLCFYWGCPNLDSFLDPRAFIQLDLDDFNGDLARIRAAIAEDEWSERLPYIRAEKERILEDYQFFPTLARAIDGVRRTRHWHVGDADRAVVAREIGDTRAGIFVEISDRLGDPSTSETLDVERRLDWSGLCLEADSTRVRAARSIRDCTVALDAPERSVEQCLRHNGLSPIAVDWLNVALTEPSTLLRDDGRLDPVRVRANLVTMFRASPAERRRCAEVLAAHGYIAAHADDDGAPVALVRSGRDEILGFYHLCTITKWREVLDEQVRRLRDSGLAGATTRILASVVGPEAADGRAALEAGLGPRVEIIHCTTDASGFERPILEHARRVCEHEAPLARAVWYAHNKGVSPQHYRNSNVADWRRLLEHFVIDRWQECLDALTDHDVCGVNWHTAPAPHFSGNFWWATPRYIATLPTRIGPEHFDAEAWIGSNQPHVCCLHDSGVDHYLTPYPEGRYRDEATVTDGGSPAARPAPTPRRTGRATICLNMIVRDEAHIVTEVLGDVAPLIDTWTIVDTGSRDGTPDVIRDFFRGRRIPGELHHRPWQSFGANRSEALALCMGTADYAWVIDADDRLVGTPDLSDLTADSYQLRYGDDFTYWRTQLFRLGLPWQYEGAVHEYPVCADPATEAHLGGDYHVESRRLGARNHAPDKYERDARLLHEAVDVDPNDARSTFYLAQSYRDAGQLERSLDWYTRRVGMTGWDEETFCALLERARLLERLDVPWAEALEAYLDAWQARPTRAEPLYEIARHERCHGRWHVGALFASRAAALPFPDDDRLFVAADVYRWRATDELAICEHYRGQYADAFALCSQLLNQPSLPAAERDRIEANRDFAAEHLLDEPRRYPAEIVEQLTHRDPTTIAACDVTLTITTCRRRELFESTVNSFLRCCEDLDRIGRWICIDDGSSDSDRARMREQYPFFEFVWKRPPDRGHAGSLDALTAMVDTPYWLHLEDDWSFFAPEQYVSKARAVLDHDRRLGQVLFNRNYGETLADRSILGGTVAHTPDGVRYRVHDHIAAGAAVHDALLSEFRPDGITNAWWPHLSLRPSLFRTDAVRAVVPFERGAAHFELDAAHRYTNLGYASAFFDTITCLHTGRLTSQRDGNGPPNAYELNGVPQFSVPSTPRLDLRIRVLNLDRRPDRWRSFVAALTDTAGAPFAARCVRVAAVDGTTLVETPELAHLFRGNDFGSRRSFIGCALSHLALWREVAAGDATTLVFEDDARVGHGFAGALDAVVRATTTDVTVPSIVFLGYQAVDPTATASETSLRLEPMRWADYIGGTFAYLVSPDAARRLVRVVELYGIQHGVDRFIQYQGGQLTVWRCVPRLVHSPLAVSGSDTDSDVQHDVEPLAPTRDLVARIPGDAAATVGG